MNNEEFLYKLKNKEYISNRLFHTIDKSLIPSDFNLDKYNDNVLDTYLVKYDEYFDNCFKELDKKILLDTDQKRAVLADEDSLLILAGAGTGKTTTLSAKVKYLVDIKHVDLSKILVMSYTKKATLELQKRLQDDLDINCDVTTFHSLGYRYIRKIFDTHKCYIVDNNTKDKIFFDYFTNLFQDKAIILEMMTAFKDIPGTEWLFSQYFKENYDKFDTYHGFLEGYKQKRLEEIDKLWAYVYGVLENSYSQELIYTLKQELVKSVGEAKIANYLFMHYIPYSYEKIYEEVMEDNKIYRPDFTVYIGETKVYIEYFGLDGDYSTKELRKYQELTKKKIAYHNAKHNKFIAVYKENLDHLDSFMYRQFKNLGFKVPTRKSNERLFNDIMDRRPLSQIFPLKDLFYNVINAIKSSAHREDFNSYALSIINNMKEEHRTLAMVQYKYIKAFYLYYQKRIFGENDYGFDFPDMIYYANKYLDKIKVEDKYDYIVVDEYQDISQDRYELIQNIANENKSKIVAFGDDWQSIYSFNGSKINYIYDFNKYFPNAKLMTICKTYRNSKEIVDYSKSFIMKNKKQINKDLVATKSLKDSVKFVLYDDLDEVTKLKKVILDIYSKNKDSKILILGRTNRVINELYNDNDLIDSMGTKLVYKGYNEIKIDAMTIHKSKGLTYDEVILLGLTNGFPNNKKGFWMLNVFRNEEVNEGIAFAEERRVFYVAMTRTLNHLYMFVPQDVAKRSPYIKEICEIMANKAVDK